MSEIKMPDLGGLLQAAQKLQGDVAKMQDELARKQVEASAGGGMVSVVVNGHCEVVKLTIEPDVVDPKEISMLQDLIVAAINQAVRKARELTQEEMAKLTGGLGIPGLPIP
jgi:hypothetical protein